MSYICYITVIYALRRSRHKRLTVIMENRMMNFRTLLLAGVALSVSTVAASARDQIRIVGSSTVFPFSTAVAEQFGKKTAFETPLVESTGSGGGLKLFCSGVGADTPDITNSSRRIKSSEWKLCNDNGVTDIIEVKIGFDGIVIGNAKASPNFDLTQEEIYKALAAEVAQYGRLAENSFKSWNEINPSLPATSIKVIGPPPTSGTRDAFEELGVQKGAKAAGLEKDKVGDVEIREDGIYVEAGENDNLIISKLEADPTALGIFGFSFLDQNASRIKGAKIDGVEPTFDNIADGAYPLSRSMYFYLKKAHIGVIPGLEEYLEEFMSEAATGEDGYTVDKGLIPLADEDREEAIEAAANLAVMTGDEKL